MIFDYEVNQNQIIVKNIDINLTNTFFSGQTFRWQQHGEGFFGVCDHRVIMLKKESDDLFISNIEEEYFVSKFAHYLDLDRDYDVVTHTFGFDELLNKSMMFAPGIRVLNQDPFETLIGFIVSANNNLARIRLIMDNISKLAGTKIVYQSMNFYSFPTPLNLSRLSENELRSCGAGYRARYIKETAECIVNGFDLEALKTMPYLEARKQLTSLAGVGNKVADCILLYSLGFANAFPLDVWTKRVIHQLYGFESKRDTEIRAFIEKKFGKYAGIAQQYLFYYVKANKIRDFR